MNVLITGAGKGIGFELVWKFASFPDSKIFVVSRNIDRFTRNNKPDLDKTSIFPIAADISDEHAVKSIIDFVKKETNFLDIVIHNAGILIHKPFQEFTKAEYDQIFSVNLWGIISLTQNLIPLLKPGSHVVTIGSMGGYQGSAKFNGMSLYSASKAAVAVLSECLSEEFRPQRISFNCLALGAVQTEMLSTAFPGYQAPLKPEEMASFIADFSLNAHKYLNGKIIPVSLSTP